MTTEAAIGYGAKFELGDGASPEAFLRIGEITKLTPPNQKADILDATNFDSAGGFKEFVLGLTDPGELKFDMNLVPGSASETALLAAQAGREARNGKITFANGKIWQFLILITDYAPDVPVDKIMTCSVTGKISGSITRS